MRKVFSGSVLQFSARKARETGEKRGLRRETGNLSEGVEGAA
jgi:hypothetical protein